MDLGLFSFLINCVVLPTLVHEMTSTQAGLHLSFFLCI
jgi:hypothetical protein